MFERLIAALERCAAAQERTNAIADARDARRLDEQKQHEHEMARAEAMHAEQQRALEQAVEAQTRSARLSEEANAARAEWERVEKEHMAQCEVRYRWMAERPELDPEKVKPAKHH